MSARVPLIWIPWDKIFLLDELLDYVWLIGWGWGACGVAIEVNDAACRGICAGGGGDDDLIRVPRVGVPENGGH